MRTLLRLNVILLGIFVLTMTIGDHVLRQEPSTAYWIAGEFRHPSRPSLFLSSPNGGVQRHILTAEPRMLTMLIDWLPDGRSLLHFVRHEDGSIGGVDAVLQRFSIDTGVDTLLNRSKDAVGEGPFYIDEIPNRNDYTLSVTWLRAAIYAISEHGELIGQLTPVHKRLLSRPLWSPDGEWLYYIASESDATDLANTLYRQRYDGSDRTEILLSGQGELLNIHPISPEFALISLRRTGATGGLRSTQLYGLSTMDGTLSLIATESGSFGYYRDMGDWLIFGYYNEFNAFINFYRLSKDGTSFEPLLGSDPSRRINRFLIGISEHEFIYSLNDFFSNFYRINIETREQVTLSTGIAFEALREAVLADDMETLIFLGTAEGISTWYRFNLRTGDLASIVPAPIAVQPSFNFERGLILHTYQSYFLLGEISQRGADYQFDVYRVNYQTGAYEHLLTHEFDINNTIRRDYPLQDGRDFVILFDQTALPTHLDRQVKIDMLTGDVESVTFGQNLKFSPYIDTDWQLWTMFLGGLGLLGLATGWSMLKFRRNEKA